MDATELGQAGLVGWRDKVAAGVADSVATRSGLREEQVRGLIGVLFFALSLYYVLGTVRRALEALR